ncbi:MAG: sulfotransferase [Bacteroidota bacterium]
MKSKIFFIVGVQRSGTTLLQASLSKHPAIAMEKRSIGFRIVTCFQNLYDLLPFNLKHDETEVLQWLIKNDDKGRLADLLDYKNAKAYGNIQALIQQSIYKKISAKGKQIWGDKSPNLQHFTSDLMRLIPEAKFIHIVRDGRANAFSMSKRSYKNLQLSAQQWVEGNVYGLVNQATLGKEKYQIVKYEDLLLRPEEVLRSICTFLDIPFSAAMFDLSSHKEIASDKRYVKTFFDTSKIDKWKQQLSEKELLKVERIQGALLQKLGYPLENEALDFKVLSLGRKLFLNQIDNFTQLFRSKKIGMREQELVELNISVKHRLYQFFTALTRDFMSLPIFKALFSRYFYKKKFFTKRE